jgi:transposase
MCITACAIIEEPDGRVIAEQRQFGAFKKDRWALGERCAGFRPQEVVLESTGIYWRSPDAALEAEGIRAKGVNACNVRFPDARPTSVMPNCWPGPVRCERPSSPPA